MSAVNRAILTPIARAVGKATSKPYMGSAIRNFLTLDGVGSYAEFAEPQVFADAYTIGFDVATTATSLQILLDTASDGLNRIVVFIQSTTGNLKWAMPGSAAVTIDGVVAANDTVSITDGKLHRIEIGATGGGTIAYVGTRYTQASFFAGVIANLTINGNTYPINSGSTLYELLPGTALGSELYAGENFTAANGGTVTYLDADTFEVSGGPGSADGGRVQSFTVEDGAVYRFAITGITGGNYTIAVYDGSDAYLASGVDSCVFRANGTTARLYITPDNGVTVTARESNVSVRKLPSTALIYHGVSAAHWEQFRRTYNPDAWTALDGDPVLEIAS